MPWLYERLESKNVDPSQQSLSTATPENDSCYLHHFEKSHLHFFFMLIGSEVRLLYIVCSALKITVEFLYQTYEAGSA